MLDLQKKAMALLQPRSEQIHKDWRHNSAEERQVRRTIWQRKRKTILQNQGCCFGSFVDVMPVFTGLISMDYDDILVERAKKEFGTTRDFFEAGYILPDGELLDFSGKKYGQRKGTRHRDHRDIIKIMPEKKDITLDEAAELFERKCIRIGADYKGFNVELNVYQNLTEEQWRTIRRIASFVSKICPNAYFAYDIYKNEKAVKFEYIENVKVIHVEHLKRDFDRVKNGEFDNVQEFNVFNFARGF